jgi:type III secretory pathway component EscS
MTTKKSQFVHHALTAITLVLVLGVLSMIWPGIIAVFLGVLLLLQALTASQEIQEIALLSWIEGGNVPIIFLSLRRLALATIPS